MKKVLAPCCVRIKMCAAIVIKTSHKHADIVDNLPLAWRRAIHPSVYASDWLHVTEMPLCWGGSKHPPALLASFFSPSARLHPCTSKYFGSCILYLAEGAVTSHPQTATTSVLQSSTCRFLCHSGTAKARVGSSFCCPNSMWNLAGQGSRSQGRIPEWHPRMCTESQYTGKGCAAAGCSLWKESSLGHPKVPHTHCWFSQVCSAGSAPAVCCFRKRSMRNICWISTFSFSDAPLHSLHSLWSHCMT